MLVDFMFDIRPPSHCGEFTGLLGAKRADSQWQKLKDILKEHGPDRTVEQWKQTWKDLKKRVRTENTAAAQPRSATDNAETVPTVSEVSTEVLYVIGHKTAMTADVISKMDKLFDTLNSYTVDCMIVRVIFRSRKIINIISG